MKLILLTSIISGLFMGCYSPAKQEVEPKKEITKPLVWTTPSEGYCRINDGIIKNDICKASWRNSKYMCILTHSRLPTIEELSKVVTDCGGKVNSSENKENVSYQNCYKEKGFTSGIYWSSTPTKVSNSPEQMSCIAFAYGTKLTNSKDQMREVRCVEVD